MSRIERMLLIPQLQTANNLWELQRHHVRPAGFPISMAEQFPQEFAVSSPSQSE